MAKLRFTTGLLHTCPNPSCLYRWTMNMYKSVEKPRDYVIECVMCLSTWKMTEAYYWEMCFLNTHEGWPT